jgi:phosphate transport system permease protein
MRKFKNFTEQGARVFFLLCALTAVLALLLIFWFLFWNGSPAIAEIGLREFIFGQLWRPRDIPMRLGIFPMIMGSLAMTAGAIVLGVPVGIFTAMFLAFMCPKSLYVVLKPVMNLLAGIPSVVYGFFGIVVLVPMVRSISGTGFSLLTAIILLSIMILPTIINISESALRAVPESYYQGAVALGASHTRAAFMVILPAAKSGVFASVILGIGRAVGETMAVVMVAGNQPRMPAGLFQGVRTLTANIVTEMAYAYGLHREALIATGIVLLVFILIINIIFTLVTRKGKHGEDGL